MVDDAVRAGRPEVVLPAGDFVLRKPLLLDGVKNLRLRGAEQGVTVLKLSPLAYARAGRAAAAGDTTIDTAVRQNLLPGTQLHIEAEGEIDSFTKQPKPYHLAILERVEGSRLILKGPLKFAVPADTLVRDADGPNLIEIRGESRGITIENLTLDGGRTR